MGPEAFAAERVRSSAGALSVADLPKGAAPKPVPLPHFPSRLHAFVWRNWSLVPVERLAEVVGARPADIRRLGAALGLGKPPRVTRDQQRRSYITVLRRNWHLLPYDQVLALLGWTPEEMAYTLREDDFLFIKLGSLKPQCDPLRFQPSDAATQERERAIAAIVRRDFPDGAADSADPPFSFVANLSDRPSASGRRHPASGIQPPASDSLRFCYSYFALYGDPLLDTESAPFPDGYLARLAEAGVTGVWLQAVLYKLAPFPWDPKLSARYEERLRNLRTLVVQARRHGMRVLLYLNEPRAMPLKFFETRPQLKGVVTGDHAALCTSAPEVQQFLRDAVSTICRAVPDLGGFFTITASENPTNCWSHGGGARCPRCGQRPPADVIAEVNRLIFEGIQRATSPARADSGPRQVDLHSAFHNPHSGIALLAWDWGWNDAWAESIINQLPPGVALMSVSEWSLPIERGGVKSAVGEYSISAIGPGPRAQRHWALARKRGLKTIAKIQAGNTWELSAVPYIPALENVAQHAANLRGSQVNGLMLGWTLGGYPSPNLEVVAEALASGSPEEAMQRVAERRFGKALAPAVVAAWRGFSAAFREFPYDGGVVYSAPQQYGPANLLWAAPTGYQATMVGFPYDDLDGWRTIYPPEVFISQLDKVADGFDQAVARLKAAASEQGAKRTKSERQSLEGELRVADAAAIHFRSTANQARFVVARRALQTAKNAEETARQVAALERILNEEIELARRLHAIQRRDSRVGFEASNHYFYVPVDLAEKVLNCRDLLDRWVPSLSPVKGKGVASNAA